MRRMPATTIIILIVMISVAQQTDPNPLFPPHGCNNFGVCSRTSLYVNSIASPPYYYCTNSSHCLCNDGTSDAVCGMVKQTCASNPCPDMLHFDCIQYINNFQCACKAAYTGDNCLMLSSDPCSSSPCKNGGKCANKNGKYACDCPDAWVGERCQYENTCRVRSNACDRGKCEMLFHGEAYKCNCDYGYTGFYCNEENFRWNFVELGCFEAPDNIMKTVAAHKTFFPFEPTQTKCRNLLDDERKKRKDVDTYIMSGADCYILKGNLLKVKTNDIGCDTTCKDAAMIKHNYAGSTEKCAGPGNPIGTGVVAQWIVNVGQDFCATKTCEEGDCYGTVGSSKCICPRHRGSTECRHLLSPCDSNPCGHASNNCTANMVDFSYHCTCANTSASGDKCDRLLKCSSKPCLYGGMCIELYNDYRCECLEYYTGRNCENIDYCKSDPCLNGKCSTILNGLNGSFLCTCEPGWTGRECETEINECLPNPCQFTGTCDEVKPPAPPFYHCHCVNGTSGTNCEINPDDCVYSDASKKINKCNKIDPKSVCVDGFNAFTCNCSVDFTGEFCEIPMVVYNVMMDIFGSMDDDVLSMLQDLLRNPSMIKDLVPFIIGLEDDVAREDMSWDAADLFDYATFEEKELDVENDLVKWNDVVLGNCFTFNHRNNTERQYATRNSGLSGGFYGKLRINQDEYFPWVDTAAILVFVHPDSEDIFSESVRYNCEPNGQTDIFPIKTQYSRLAGKHGVCVNTPEEVDAYFYTGAYTTDGCLRSCYQNAVQESCGCMDPRYPIAEGAKTCDLKTRNCVEAVTANRGDPSDWKECVCPLPCRNQQYDVQWSRSLYPANAIECSSFSDILQMNNCTSETKDTVIVTVSMPTLTVKQFAETETMDFNTFIGKLGGLLGVLMGISVVSFIEIGFLIFHSCYVICSKP